MVKHKMVKASNYCLVLTFWQYMSTETKVIKKYRSIATDIIGICSRMLRCIQENSYRSVSPDNKVS
jgi:hypothetical protein